MDDPKNSKSYESGVQMLQQAADSMHETPNDIYKYICGHIMTHMTATTGIKKHGQAAVDVYNRNFASSTTRMFLIRLTRRRSRQTRNEKPSTQ